MSDQATVPIVRTLAELQAWAAEWRAAGERIGLVPTMGALHAGHLSLVEASMQRYERTVATLFVNPKQFNDPADYANYPRTEESDAAKLGRAGADLLYCPNPEEVYPPGFSTTVSVTGVSEGLCGAARPGHFDGVATVCSKLFLQSRADGAFFGEKDFQQFKVVERVAADLNIPIAIHSCPTVRDVDGLALSSRNQHLSPEQRALAPALYRALIAGAARLAAGDDPSTVIASTERAIRDGGYSRVDYLDIRRESNLARSSNPADCVRFFGAAFLGSVRLIDNVRVPNKQALTE